RPDARILVLDNHDDFGGHAKRNEFTIDGKVRIGYGGTESIDTPSAYSEAAKQTLVDIGIDTAKFYQAFDQTLYAKLKLARGIVFDAENFGRRTLVTGYGQRPWEEFAAQAPLNEQARKDFIRVQTETVDYLPGLSREQKYEKLRKVSYETFLREYCKEEPKLLELGRKWGISSAAVGITRLPATSTHAYG